MLAKLFSVFKKRTLGLTQKEISRVANYDGAEKICELLWREYLKQRKFNSVVERTKNHASFHAGFVACLEYKKVLK